MPLLFRIVLAVVALLLAVAGARAADPTGPSFDCAKAARPVEHAICSDEVLKLYDWWIDALYRDALALAPEKAPDLRQTQRDWLRERDRRCAVPPDTAAFDSKVIVCLMRMLDARAVAIAAQSVQPIWRHAAADPAKALARLRTLHSPLAGLYGDLLSHALADEDMAAFDKFTGDVAEHFDDPLWKYAPEVRHIVIPCALADRFPRLLLTARGYFGSSLDLSLPVFDCMDEAGVPKPVEAFLRNNIETEMNWLDRCRGEGTIFHGYARNVGLLEFRMIRFPRSYLSDQITWTRAPDRPWPSDTEIADSNWAGAADFEAARRALAKDYVARRGLTAAEAATAATRALFDNRGTRTDAEDCTP